MSAAPRPPARGQARGPPRDERPGTSGRGPSARPQTLRMAQRGRAAGPLPGGRLVVCYSTGKRRGNLGRGADPWSAGLRGRQRRRARPRRGAARRPARQVAARRSAPAAAAREPARSRSSARPTAAPALASPCSQQPQPHPRAVFRLLRAIPGDVGLFPATSGCFRREGLTTSSARSRGAPGRASSCTVHTSSTPNLRPAPPVSAVARGHGRQKTP